MKYVLFYPPGEHFATRGAQFLPAHQQRIRDFHRQGSLLMIGPLDNPPVNGAMAVFASREAAEEFAKEDPFVRNGVVGDWRIHEWTEILA
jgi:uncharacterized protein YciI